MANSNGNIYSFIIISNEWQVFGIDSSQKPHSLSNTNFAMDIGISEDGTLWAISQTPDPDGGGARIYWSTGNGTWNEIATSDPGGVHISGGTGSSCYYTSGDGSVRKLDTDGTSSVYDDSHEFLEFDYGGGYVWAVFSDSGAIAKLYYSKANTLSWSAFAGDPMPYSISAGYEGQCFAIDSQGDPVYYGTNGSSTGSSGSGLNGLGMQASSKNWSYVLSYDVNQDGNLVYVWVDTSGGTYQATSIRANKVLATYNLAS